MLVLRSIYAFSRRGRVTGTACVRWSAGFGRAGHHGRGNHDGGVPRALAVHFRGLDSQSAGLGGELAGLSVELEGFGVKLDDLSVDLVDFREGFLGFEGCHFEGGAGGTAMTVYDPCRSIVALRKYVVAPDVLEVLLMSLVFPNKPPALIPVAGTQDQVPVRRVYCVGRNYAAHAIEMGHDPDREPPFFFCKPGDSDCVLPVAYGQELQLPYPSRTRNFHHEVELVVVIGKAGMDIPVDRALDHVWGYALGLDMTRRDLQFQMRDKGRPWEIGKAFDCAAPIGPIHRASDVGHLRQAGLWLNVNGVSRQKSDISQLTWSVPETVVHLSSFFSLAPGDLIYTGTPEGVGPVVPGDVITAGLEGLGEFRVRIT